MFEGIIKGKMNGVESQDCLGKHREMMDDYDCLTLHVLMQKRDKAQPCFEKH